MLHPQIPISITHRQNEVIVPLRQLETDFQPIDL